MEDIKISYEEKEKLHKAFRQHEFRILFDEYFEEISNEKYRKEKEDYLLSLYFKGELKKDQIIIQPKEAFCIKTKILYSNQTSQKIFLNICTHEGIQNICFENAGSGSVGIPYSLSQIRPDKYGNNMSCLSIDCCVNPFTIDVIRKYNEVFNFMLEDVCLNIEKNIMKDKERICRDFKMLSNMKCKGEKPFLLCINKNVLKKNILLEEEKKLEKLKKEYEEKNETSKDVDNVLKKSKIQTEIKTYNQEEINKSNIQILDDNNNNNIKEDIMENYKKDGRKNKFFIYHQGSINMSSFFKIKEYKNTPISLNLPDKLKVVIYTDNYVNKNDINITIQRKRKIVEIKFNNKEKDLTINLPYPCDEKDYSCVLYIEKKKIEIYLKLYDEYVKRYAQEIYDKYISEEKDAFGYIDEVVEQYEQEEKNKNNGEENIVIGENKNNGEENIVIEENKNKEEENLVIEENKNKEEENIVIEENKNKEEENIVIEENKNKEEENIVIEENKNKEEENIVIEENNEHNKEPLKYNNYCENINNVSEQMHDNKYEIDNSSLQISEDILEGGNRIEVDKRDNKLKLKDKKKCVFNFELQEKVDHENIFPSTSQNRSNNLLHYKEKDIRRDLNIELINESPTVVEKSNDKEKIFSPVNYDKCYINKSFVGKENYKKEKIHISERDFLIDTYMYEGADTGMILSSMLWYTYI
ncbi:conserved Plasmodium protein, unknown function [Plasmodium reichenowi]|uniref:PIH1 N-terminal domain-containing protein n=1 Tax=Plasmodium reichenowi TaxID=5854 RepID=A0A2P9DDD0_PLARE|nr:conserved Plasmodium protein, unknown function [Plasmodium reichenowi]